MTINKYRKLYGQPKANLIKIFDALVENTGASKTQQRSLIKRELKKLSKEDLEYLTVTEICDEIIGGFADYFMLRDTFLRTYARDVRTDHRGKIDVRKFKLSVVKIAKREGMATSNIAGLDYHTNRIEFVTCFSRIEFERKESRALTSFDKGMAYEKQVVAALINNGLSAELTASGADFGADLTFSFMGKLFVGQCKALNKACGVKAVQETVSAISHYNANHGVVFSELGFSDPAIKLAESNQAVLVTGLDIKSMMRQIIILE